MLSFSLSPPPPPIIALPTWAIVLIALGSFVLVMVITSDHRCSPQTEEDIDY